MSDLFLTSCVLSARHGFSTRTGGVSQGPFALLNLGFSVGDAPERVENNLELLAKAAGLPRPRLFTANQVHGSHLVSM